jgi:type I restriction enzyme, R subunit
VVNDVTRLLADVKLLLDNEDLGKAFYDRLIERSGTRLLEPIARIPPVEAEVK